MVTARHKNHLRLCQDTDAVIAALGGKEAVMAITGRSQNNVINWRTDGVFPSNTFVVMTKALEARGYTAPPSLWRMLDVP